MTSVEALLAPRSVALVGASDTPGSLGALLWRNLEGFPGTVLPVSASAATVGGVPAVRSLRGLAAPVDLAVVAVPAPAVPAVAADAVANGTRVIVVLSAGFAEAGEDGARLQQQVLATARAGGVRILGPNCFGVQSIPAGLNASLAAGLPQDAGAGISLITQSGAYGMAIHTLGLEEGLPFARVLSIGNAADIDAAELLARLADDPATAVCALFLEGVADARPLLAAIRAAARRIPVVVAKTGRSEAGAHAALSHTAALAGAADRWEAALEGAGAVVARSGLEMLDIARTVLRDPRTDPARPRGSPGSRAAIVTNSGGVGAELADHLASAGVDVPALSAGLQEQLRRRLPAHGSAANPVDLTPAWPRFAELYPAVTELVARSGEVDVVVPVLLQRAALDAGVAAGLVAVAERLRADGVDVAITACWVAPREAHDQALLLQGGGIACIPWPERTARAVGGALVASRRAIEAVEEPPPQPSRLGPALPAAGPVPPLLAAAVLAAHGVALVRTLPAATSDGAVAAAAALGYPVVVKTADPATAHRTEQDAVRVGLVSPDAVRAAAGELLTALPAGLLVQPELVGVEVVVGGVNDGQLGPLVAVGLGGTFVEVLADVAFAPAPLTLPHAHRLLDRLRGRAVLDGVRGAPARDRQALARVVVAAGDVIAAHPELAALDLNPVIVGATGAAAVDWYLQLA